MNNRLLRAARFLLLVWGAISLVGAVAVVAIVAGQFARGFHEQVDKASTRDVRFVLNWCGLGEGRIDSVVRSHVSAVSPTGDYLDAYAIRISHIELSELSPDPGGDRRWFRGDALPATLDQAVGFAGGWFHEIPWFPSEAELRSSSIYVFPWSIEFHGVEPRRAELIFVRPSDKMVFYFGAKS